MPVRLNLEVLQILDALEKHGSFATAAASLFKTPAALSYMIQKLESELNIVILDRSGHRAKFTETGRMVLKKGRLLLSAARDLEKQAEQVQAGWEKELTIVLDAAFPFETLLPAVGRFHELNTPTRLNFSHHTLAGAWEALTHCGADIVLGAIDTPPTSAAWSYKMLGTLDNIFVVAPGHPLAAAQGPLSNEQICRHRGVVIKDSARSCPPINSNLLEEQPQMVVDNFHAKVALLRAGLACGFLPRHIARQWLSRGELVEKAVSSCREKDVAYMAWRDNHEGLALRWWHEALLSSHASCDLYR